MSNLPKEGALLPQVTSEVSRLSPGGMCAWGPFCDDDSLLLYLNTMLPDVGKEYVLSAETEEVNSLLYNRSEAIIANVDYDYNMAQHGQFLEYQPAFDAPRSGCQQRENADQFWNLNEEVIPPHSHIDLATLGQFDNPDLSYDKDIGSPSWPEDWLYAVEQPPPETVLLENDSMALKSPKTQCRMRVSQGKKIKAITKVQAPSRCVYEPKNKNTKGQSVTTALRALIRHLLAGTNWIMDSSIRKDDAISLIRELLGMDLRRRLGFGDASGCLQSDPVCYEIKKKSYLHVFADVVSTYVGFQVSAESAKGFIRRDKGPYNLTDEFTSLLGEKPWPPCMPSVRVLKAYKCYMPGLPTSGKVAKSNFLENSFELH